jgi:SsrA-binding protein
MTSIKIIAQNRKALFDYAIEEKFEAGVVLTGGEVKSVKAGHVNLKESYAVVKDEEMWLLNAHISPYRFSNQENYEPTRSRKLLLSKKEIKFLIGKINTKGLTLVPLKIYLKHGLIKIELGLGKGRKKFDKREVIKNRDIDREIKQRLKVR